MLSSEVIASEELLRRYREGERDFTGIEVEDRPGTAPLRGSVLDGAIFDASFIVANFDGASLRGTRFVGANLKTCSFDGADLTDTGFSQAALCSTIFQGARMVGANFEGATYHSHMLGRGETPHW